MSQTQSMRILLINPGQLPHAGEDQFSGRMDSVFFRLSPLLQTYFGIPLALPTLAGVTPDHHDVIIIDEMVQKIDFAQPCDLVGITAMTSKAPRAYQIAAEFKARGIPVIMGGIHASMCPEEAAQHVDSVVVGEADEIWPSILEDLARGELKALYRPDFPNLENTMPPRHLATSHSRYFSFLLQTTRGCPRNCNFCTVTAMNGRRLRKKSPAQVVEEVRQVVALPNPVRPVIVDRDNHNRTRRLAGGAIFFVDDNFAIDRKHALAVCAALKTFQDEKNVHINWFTQADIKTGFDDELLAAMKDAGCMNIFIGFESLSDATLSAMQKQINSPKRYMECIHNIERHGIEVTASVIIGADDDTDTCGDEVTNFAITNHLFYLFPNIMTPYPGTGVMTHMATANRLLSENWSEYNIRNVVFRPKQMSPSRLRQQYVRICTKALNMQRLFETAKVKCTQPKRFHLTRRWRVAVLFAFTGVTIALGLVGKLTFREVLICLRRIPWLVIKNGSLNALGFIVNAIGFGTFARSEAKRLKEFPTDETR
ncbi:MAG: B12-binding domain-containing radical SAM protein [Deltaproteobacteria bacterium]|nr:B12-binding domain-containing radical SAM protein [Deltaproteobacteria bacterium]